MGISHIIYGIIEEENINFASDVVFFPVMQGPQTNPNLM